MRVSSSKLHDIAKTTNQINQELLTILKQKLELKSIEDWNLLNTKQIKSNGGRNLLKNLSLYEIKCKGCPEGKQIFKKPLKPKGYWKEKENILKFLSNLRENLKLKTPEDWNALTIHQIREFGGNSLLKEHSIYELKLFGCPEGKQIFTKPLKPEGYWNNEENIQIFLNELRENFNLTSQQDWNSLTTKQIKANGGSSLLNIYSINEIKLMGCPQLNISKKLQRIWDTENVKQFLFELAKTLNLNTMDDWNKLTVSHIISNGGGRLFQFYSIYDLKCIGFPEGKEFFKKPNKTMDFWNKKENISNFLAEIGKKLNMKTINDWDSITSKQIEVFGGGFLLKLYSLYELKCIACPEGKSFFKPSKVSKKKSGFWNDFDNIQHLLHHLAKTLNLQTLEDWDNISYKHIIDCGAGTLLNYYSLYQLKCFGFPEGKEFFSLPNKTSGYWDENENIKHFIDEMKSTFNLKNPSDWNRVSKSQIQSLGGSGFISKYLTNQENRKQIESEFPEISYIGVAQKRESYALGKSSQRWLFLQVQKLFPGEEIVEDYFHSELSRKTGSSFQFDVFVIGRNIAFEYHGKQHYEELVSGFAPLEMYKNRDQEKEKICSDHGIQLIIIPYWWNNRLESLNQTVEKKLMKTL